MDYDALLNKVEQLVTPILESLGLELIEREFILDQGRWILRLYIEKDLSREDIIKKGYNAKVVKDVIQRVDRNEYKRRQAPPGIKITERAFGKDRRLPITNRYSGL